MTKTIDAFDRLADAALSERAAARRSRTKRAQPS